MLKYFFCIVICLNSIVSVVGQNLILNPSFEIPFNSNHNNSDEQYFIYNSNSSKKTSVLGWYSARPNFYIPTKINYGKLHVRTDKKGSMQIWLIATPSQEGYTHLILRDNFFIYTPVNIKKNKKYRLDYYLNKPFMVNLANKYFYIHLVLSKNAPNNNLKSNFQRIKNRIPHGLIPIQPSVEYKEDTVIIEPRPDLWQKFSVEFVAEDDFEFLGLVRDIQHPQGLTEFMHLDNVKLYLVEDNTNENEELTSKINNLAQQIQFETGSSRLTPPSLNVLDSLYFYLKNNIPSSSGFFVEINGYTDNEGNEKANLLLSQERVKTVQLFFQAKDNTQILSFMTTGFGDSQPLVSNDTPEGKSINRRVEIKLIPKTKAKNILFESLSFEEAKEKAKKENKLIFIDAYTSWCKPCKLMDRDVFTDSIVASIFNENFINLKIDMESEVGKPLNEKYEIKGYPTFLFVDFEGNLKYRKEGFMNAVELSNFGGEVIQLKNEKNTESTADILNERLYEKAKIEYTQNPCKVEFIESYFNLIDKERKEEIQKVQFDYVQCLENSQKFSSKQVAFLLNNLTQNRSDIAYNFYLKNKEKFEKNYGDSLLVLEGSLEEGFFLQETDTLKNKVDTKEKLTQKEVDEYEKIVTRYIDFSQKIEKESKEKGFERPIKQGFVDYIIYITAIQFYEQHKEVHKFSKYLIQYNQLEKLDSYRDDVFGDMTIPLRKFGVYTLHYLEIENKEEEILKELSLIWKDLISKNYLSNYESYFTAAKVFYSNKEKQEAQKMLQKAFELKDENFEEKQYKILETQINQL